MKFILLVIFFTITTFFAREITLEELNKYPKSISKDFYIWMFLQQDNISKKEAHDAYEQVKRKNSKLEKVYIKKVGTPRKSKSSTKNYCASLRGSKLAYSTNIKCILESITPSRATLLTTGEQLHLSKTLLRANNKEARKYGYMLRAIGWGQPISKTLYSSPDIYLELFNNAGDSYRESSRLNEVLTYSFVNKLAKEKGFEAFVRKINSNKKLDKLQKSLEKVEPNREMDISTIFEFAFDLVEQNEAQKAVKFFKAVENYSTYQANIDKARFWLYLISKNKNYLYKLTKSWDINIYTLYAKEKLQKPIDNIISNFNLPDVKPLFRPQMNPSNPLDWEITKREIYQLKKERHSEQKLFHLADRFKTKSHESVYTYILEKAYNYQKHTFPMPYRDVLKDLSIEDQAMIYALARQESKFIPGSVSISYALGMMQIMPFLVKDIAKRKGEKIELEDMFDPRKNLEYAIYHLKDLKKQFKSPLFIAYAYNGGMGFTRRTLGGGAFTKSKYEPFLSMEKIAYTETREYGKKVLVNYLIYRQLLGSPVLLHSLLNDTVEPSRSDYVRK